MSSRRSPCRASWRFLEKHGILSTFFVPGHTAPAYPELTRRGHRMLMLERLVESIREKDGIVFGRLDEYSERWREASPLAAWLRTEPTQARKTAADGLSGPRTV